MCIEWPLYTHLCFCISTCMQFFLILMANGLLCSFKLRTSVILFYQTHRRGYNGVNETMSFTENISKLLKQIWIASILYDHDIDTVNFVYRLSTTSAISHESPHAKDGEIETMGKKFKKRSAERNKLKNSKRQRLRAIWDESLSSLIQWRRTNVIIVFSERHRRQQYAKLNARVRAKVK